MKNITGQAVSGSDFFPRPREIKKIKLALQSGAHLLPAAPRRVGKTSLLFHLQDIEDKTPYYFIWVITESVDTVESFFERDETSFRFISPILKRWWYLYGSR
ncbi:MAG: hypothetical protein QNK37_07430 [Acidobacteriota bacterium]|nr:hypothetical protein [Acidobacteriota bacterium]